MNSVTVRNLEIGAGAPKIIVPIVARSTEEILRKAKELLSYSVDLVEWRADFYDRISDPAESVATARALNRILKNIPILFTFRTKKEGGDKEISMSAYTALNKALADSGAVDLIDVEIFSGDAVVRENIANIHAAGVKVVGSNHDFLGTPEKADIIYRLRVMQDYGADIPKIAVMPKTPADVITLLDATQEMHNKYADRPILTMSMSPMGVISRVCGDAFGSCMTFGAVGQVSAPGQIPVEKLEAVLSILHSAS